VRARVAISALCLVACASAPPDLGQPAPAAPEEEARGDDAEVGAEPVVRGPGPRLDAAGATWLDQLNRYRTMAGLVAISEDPASSVGARRHAAYMLATGALAHDEDPSSAAYTEEGDIAARSSAVVGARHASSYDQAIDDLMSAPFDALALLRPELRRSGFGEASAAGGGALAYAAAVDVRRGLELWRVGERVDAVVFPGVDSIVPLRVLREGAPGTPDPLGACAGYVAPAGLPILVQLPRDLTTRVRAHVLRENARPVAHCVFDAETFSAPDSASEEAGRALLRSQNAIVVLPRAPLAAGATYTVTLATEDASMGWSFRVSASAP